MQTGFLLKFLAIPLILLTGTRPVRAQEKAADFPLSAPGVSLTPSDLPQEPIVADNAVDRRLAELEAEIKALRGEVSEARSTDSMEFTPEKSLVPSEVHAGSNGTIKATEDHGKPLAPNMPATLPKFPLSARFGNGFELVSEEENFVLQFHSFTQIDGRFYNLPSRAEVQDSFTLPRQRLIFQGKVYKHLEFVASTQFNVNTFNLLDAFVNVRFDDRLQFKVGRYKTPFTYEIYVLPIHSLVNPERSLFFNNFALNRDVGGQLWGTIFDKHVDYAVGLFNGQRNGFLDTNKSKDLAAYFNVKPFLSIKESCLENMNIGISMNYGDQNQLAFPRIFSTLVPDQTIASLGVPFLTLDPNVRESGQREFYSVHFAWYYNQMSFINEYEFGYANFSRANNFPRTQVDVQGFYSQLGYFITGERVTMRGQVQPRHNFDIRQGKRGCGAWEPFGRFSFLDIDNKLLQFGDGRSWTDSVNTVAVGVNWYWNPNVKWVFEYERATFGDPVFVAPGLTQNTNDAVILRAQLYY